MNSTTFAHINNCFRLTIDSSKATITTAWLAAQGCTFDRYIRANGTTEYVFIRISDEVTYAIAWKYPMPAPIDTEKVKFVTTEIMSEFREVCRRFTFDDGGLSQEDVDFLAAHNLDLSDEERDVLIVI